MEDNYDGAVYWPVAAPGKDFPDVPEQIAAAAGEAHRCLSFNASRAAIAMGRAVIEATAKDKGITDGKLQTKIDSLYKRGHIREHIKEAAHELRHFGNEVAHGDLAAEPISDEDAAEMIGLMDEVLVEVYQSPARVRRLRESREARHRAQSESAV
jgi:Domain of unknown function (DUF4145)